MFSVLCDRGGFTDPISDTADIFYCALSRQITGETRFVQGSPPCPESVEVGSGRILALLIHVPRCESAAQLLRKSPEFRAEFRLLDHIESSRPASPYLQLPGEGVITFRIATGKRLS